MPREHSAREMVRLQAPAVRLSVLIGILPAAEALEVSPQTVCTWRRQAGVFARRGPRRTPLRPASACVICKAPLGLPGFCSDACRDQYLAVAP